MNDPGTSGQTPHSDSTSAYDGEREHPPAKNENEPRHRVPRRSSRRSPWNRRRDRVAAALLVVGSLTAGLLVWGFSDIRATTSEQAAPPGQLPPAPADVPSTLTERWRAPSAATPVPVAARDSVVTGDGGEVLGRDPRTGDVRWRYARDRALCTVGAAWEKAIVVHRKASGCSETTALDPATGTRTAQRNGDTQLGTQLTGDSSHVVATGPTLLHTWRNDLVKDTEYGDVPAPVEPNKQPRPGCSYGSIAITSGRVGVMERCAGEPADRLTVVRAEGKETYEPNVLFSTPVGDRSAQLVAMSGGSAAVALPNERLLVMYGPDGQQRAAYPLSVPSPELATDPPGKVPATVKGPDGIYWFTGSATVALSRTDLTPQWTLPGTRGPGTLFAHHLVVPIQGGLAVLDDKTGATVRTIGVDRRGYTGKVELTSIGPMLLEQRGDTLVALS